MTMPEFDPAYLEYRVNHRLALWRRAAIFVPAAVIISGLAIWSALGLPQTFVMVILFGAFALAMDFEALATLRDLRAQPVTTVGNVGRSWNKGRFLIFGRVHYIMVQRRLYEIGPVTARELDFGDEVTIYHWPHTNSIITLRVTGRADGLDHRGQVAPAGRSSTEMASEPGPADSGSVWARLRQRR